MSDWTKEPWKVVDCDEYAEVVVASDDPSFDGGLIATIHHGGDISYLADAHRIVSCVNALTGFPNPEADVRTLVEALERIRDRTLRDAEPPELRAQNENNYRDAVQVLSRLRREP